MGLTRIFSLCCVFILKCQAVVSQPAHIYLYKLFCCCILKWLILRQYSIVILNEYYITNLVLILWLLNSKPPLAATRYTNIMLCYIYRIESNLPLTGIFAYYETTTGCYPLYWINVSLMCKWLILKHTCWYTCLLQNRHWRPHVILI